LLAARSPKRGAQGFTLLELIVVITIMLILLGIAVPMYNQSILAKNESNLRQNLRTLNQVIDQYTIDKQKAPSSLEELKSAGYIERIPEDITGRTDTWELVEDDSIKTLEQNSPGVSAVKSGSNRVGTDGTAYSEW
jgi:general secretion pathway protein G